MHGAIQRREPGRAALFAAVAVSSLASSRCAPAIVEVPVATVSVGPTEPPGPAGPTPADRLLALLTADNPRLERVAMTLASLQDDAALRAAGTRLVALARAVGSPAWREADRARFLEDVADGVALPTHPDARLEERETRALTGILAAMSHVGGPVVIGYAFSLAGDDAAPWDRRRLALRLLGEVLDPADTERVARREALAARLPAPRTTPASGEGLAAFIPPLRRAFRSCYVRALQQDPALQARVHLTVDRRDGRGATVKVEGKDLPADFARCLEDAARALRAVDPAEWGGQIVIPFVFAPPR